jgi:ferrous iron transport protein B
MRVRVGCLRLSFDRLQDSHATEASWRVTGGPMERSAKVLRFCTTAARWNSSRAPDSPPVGFNWQISVALIPGMAAREVAVAALGTVYAIEGGKEAAEQIGQALASNWSLATALALLVWYIFAPQCASTLAVIKRETGSWRWMAITFGYMLALAYVGAFVTYNVAVVLGAG